MDLRHVDTGYMQRLQRRVVVMRHGETLWNVQRRRQGQLDSPLTDRGRAQVHHTAQQLRSLGIDAIYSSPLDRAIATTAIVGDSLDLPTNVVGLACEVDHGDFAGLTNDEIEARQPGALARREANKYLWTFPGGESYLDATNRARRLVAVLDASPATTPLVVTHEMFARMLVAELSAQPPEQALTWKLGQGQVWTSWPPHLPTIMPPHPNRPGPFRLAPALYRRLAGGSRVR